MTIPSIHGLNPFNSGMYSASNVMDIYRLKIASFLIENNFERTLFKKEKRKFFGATLFDCYRKPKIQIEFTFKPSEKYMITTKTEVLYSNDLNLKGILIKLLEH